MRRTIHSQLLSHHSFKIRKPPLQLFQSTRKLSSDVPKTILTDHSLPSNDVQARRQAVKKTSLTDLFSLNERAVVITGAGRGLGITLASAVLDAGGDVVCLDVLPEPSELEWSAIMKLAEQTGRHAKYYQCDITNEEDVQGILAEAGSQAEKRSSPIRGLISCAGVQQMVDAIDYPLDGFKRILNINVTGSFVVAKHTARLMREAKNSGSIVFIASMSGQIANRGIHCSAYNTSKAAVQQMSRSLATEWGQYGIRVNSLSPGYIRTAMTDLILAEKPELEKLWMAGALLTRLGAVEDFKAPAVYLLADGASFMTGAVLRVDGGHCASA
ncbi:dehydrogenase with different specificitie [Cadophora sp. MPI-SDFR-AT-0126]|nr:dehydrogenase with different specificitie [Leotiomycetes sp. MPI-SDFR-AT-0126]